MTTAYTFVAAPRHLYPDHPEHPSRFHVLAPQLDSFGAQAIGSEPATTEQVARVHRQGLIAALEAVCSRGDAIIDPAPTFVTRSSYKDALDAAGATIACTRAVTGGSFDNAFAIVRPPGHHAEPERSMGFCLFNNVAIAACDALSAASSPVPGRRVAIVDYDAHHGNGTQAAFLNEPSVAYLSTHQWGIYPGTGWITDASHAKKRIVNLPLPARSGDQVFARAADAVIAPFLRSFQPDLLLVSAGFDAHWNDPITTLGLSTAGFYMLSKRLVDLAKELCGSRIVFVLEGGYDATNLANGAAAVFAALTGSAAGPQVADAMPHAEPESAMKMIEDVRQWHGF